MTLVVLAALLSVGDIVARHEAQHLIAQRIDQRVPGAHASVVISSFPFVERVAASGSVPKLTAHVTGVSTDGLAFGPIDVTVHDLVVDRSKLLHGQVAVQSIRQAVVHATIPAASLSHAVGLSLTLGAGTIGVGGLPGIPAHLAVSGDQITVTISPLPGFTLTIPKLDLLPCIGDVTVVPGQLDLACTTTTIPAALLQSGT